MRLVEDPTLRPQAAPPGDSPTLPVDAWGPARPRVVGWHFWAAMAAQALLVAFIGGTKGPAYNGPTTMFVPIRMFDPIDPLKGRYVALSYGYDTPDDVRLQKLKGWHEGMGPDLYLTFVPGKTPTAPWRAVAVNGQKPQTMPPGAGLFHMTVVDGRLESGAGQYMIPDAAGESVDQALRDAMPPMRDREKPMDQWKAAPTAELRVDGDGNPFLAGLWIGNRKY